MGRLWLVTGSSFSVAAFVGVLVMWAVQRDGDVRYGDVGGWIAGIGSILAAVAAVGIAIYTNKRQDRKEDEERANARARALRRARRVVVTGDRHDTQDRLTMKFLNTGDYDAYHFGLHNTGTTPIYDVTWSPPVAAYIPYTPRGQPSQPRLEWIADAQLMQLVDYEDETPPQREGIKIRDIDPFVLAPGDKAEIRVSIQNIRAGASNSIMPFTVYNRISYVDEDGYRMGWVYRRINESVPITAENSVRGHWAIVDDDYPNNVNDAIRELDEQAPPR